MTQEEVTALPGSEFTSAVMESKKPGIGISALYGGSTRMGGTFSGQGQNARIRLIWRSESIRQGRGIQTRCHHRAVTECRMSFLQ